jgi:hypothetical protein
MQMETWTRRTRHETSRKERKMAQPRRTLTNHKGDQTVRPLALIALTACKGKNSPRETAAQFH